MRARCVLPLLVIVMLFGVLTSHALAQLNYRSWLASNGADINTCTRDAPCKTLAVAIAATTNGGVISLVDPVELSDTTITKSITLDGTGSLASLTVTNNGLRIDGPNVRVVIRGFDIDGASVNGPGQVGVQFVSGASLVLEDVTLGNNQIGIEFGPSGPAKLVLRNVSINSSNTGLYVEGSASNQIVVSDTKISNVNGHGIHLNQVGGTTKLTIANSQVTGNGGNGLMISPTGSAKVNTTITGSVLDGNVIGIRSFPGGSAVSNVTISDTSTSNNAGGIHASGKSVVSIIRGAIGGNLSYGVGAVSPAAVRIGSSVVSGNTLGFSGPISSYGNNQLHGNGAPGSSSPLPTSGMP